MAAIGKPRPTPLPARSMIPRPATPLLRRDYREIGCAWCRHPSSIGDSAALPLCVPPPYASLDARDDVRMHRDCHTMFIWAIWTMLGVAPIPEWFLT